MVVRLRVTRTSLLFLLLLFEEYFSCFDARVIETDTNVLFVQIVKCLTNFVIFNLSPIVADIFKLDIFQLKSKGRKFTLGVVSQS